MPDLSLHHSRPAAAPAPPRASVIITNYNTAGFVGAAIDSALAQTNAAVEVVVVDDGSTDASRAVLEAFGDRVRLVFQANGGQAAAINAGVAASRGAILCFLDSDDWWEPGKVAQVVQAFDADPGAVLVYHRMRAFRQGEGPCGRSFPRSLCRGDLTGMMARSAGWWPFPMTSSVAVRRSAWNRIGPIPEAFRISADAWLVGIYPYFGRVGALPGTLGWYRLHGTNNWSRAADPALLRKRMAHWRATVERSTAFLASRGIDARLSMADHLPFRIAAAQLDPITPAVRLDLARRGLTFAGEPRLLRRLIDVVRTDRDLAAVAAAARRTRGVVA